MILHISHTDLDGYGCQYVSYKFNSNQFIFENIDYGQFDRIFEYIKQYNPKKILITDINLDKKTAEKLQSFNFMIIDHHNWNFEYPENVIVDKSHCATKLYYRVTKIDNSIMNWIIDLIDIYDTWQKNERYFEIAKLLNDLVMSDWKEFINKNLKRKFIFNLIDSFGEISYNNRNVNDIELKKGLIIRNAIKKTFKNFDNNSSNKENILKNQLTYFKNNVIIIDDKVISNIDSGNFQILSSLYLDENPDVVCINYKRESNNEMTDFINTISVRSRNGKALEITKQFGGGGHQDAAGAIIDANNFEELVQKIKHNLN